MNTMLRSGLVFSLFFVVFSASQAGVIRHDRPDASYTNLAAQPQFNGIGTVDFFSPSAGTLIAPNWLLTAGHLPGITEVTFGLGTPNQTSYQVLQNVPHPNWTGSVINGNDFRLIQLNGNPIADGVATQVYSLYRGPILDQVVTNVGYGATGNGVTGYDPNSFGTRRAGNMMIRSYFIEGNNVFNNTTLTRTTPTTIMLADFISPDTNLSTLLSIINGFNTTAAPQDLEYMLGPRDSGSPVFIFDNGEWKIAGISSFIATQNAQGQGPQGIYGDVSGFAVFDDFTANWIHTTAIPEPGTIILTSLLVAAGLGAGWYRYRTRRNAEQQLVEMPE